MYPFVQIENLSNLPNLNHRSRNFTLPKKQSRLEQLLVKSYISPYLQHELKQLSNEELEHVHDVLHQYFQTDDKKTFLDVLGHISQNVQCHTCHACQNCTTNVGYKVEPEITQSKPDITTDLTDVLSDTIAKTMGVKDNEQLKSSLKNIMACFVSPDKKEVKITAESKADAVLDEFLKTESQTETK